MSTDTSTPPGKTVEYKQKRCITFARHGILALNLEWLSYGELDRKDMFSELGIRDGMESLAYVLQKPVEYGEAPELFCLDLLRVTDLDRLAALSSPVRVFRLAVL
jgi:hypothetical protein